MVGAVQSAHALHQNTNPPSLYLNIPCIQDLCSKSFLEVCGDLNLPILLVWSIFTLPSETALGIPLGFGYREPTAMNLIMWKMIMAYFGQLCHSMSHMPASRRPGWVTALQNAGFMIHPKQHAQHHKTYDDKFCIGSGMWNPAVSSARNVTDKVHIALGGSSETNAYGWLVALGVAMIFDIPVLLQVLRPILG
jgi:hypothetical protein